MKRFFPLILVFIILFFFTGCQVPGGSEALQKISKGLEELEELDQELDELEMKVDELTSAFNELSKAFDDHLEKHHKAKPHKIYIKKEITK